MRIRVSGYRPCAGLPTRDTWVVPGHAAHQGLLTRSATNSYESTPRGSEGFGSPATAGCKQGAARVTPQATSPRARRPGCRARTARRGGAVDDHAHVYMYACMHMGAISSGRLREEEELPDPNPNPSPNPNPDPIPNPAVPPTSPARRGGAARRATCPRRRRKTRSGCRRGAARAARVRGRGTSARERARAPD